MKRSRSAQFVAGGLAVVLAVLVVTLATRDSALGRRDNSPLLGKRAPELAGMQILGRPSVGIGDDVSSIFDIDDQQGRFVLVNFFATWCGPCRDEHDDLRRFAEVHSATDDARVVSVIYRGDDRDDVEDFFAARGGDWPVVEDDGGAIATAWGVVGIPESYLVDPSGRVVSKIIGGAKFNALESLMDRVRRGT